MRVNCCVIYSSSQPAIVPSVGNSHCPLFPASCHHLPPPQQFMQIRILFLTGSGRGPEQNCQETITEYCITVFYYIQYIYSLLECSFEAKIKEGRLHRTLQQSSTSYCTYMLNGHPITHNMLNRTPYKPQFEMLPSHLQYIQQVNGIPYHPQQVKQDTLPPTTGKLYCRGK